ncbi:MAG TPA: phosphonate ABC transporter, permease protein PhnE [Agrobacterium sp.]|uniref:phosphonate ABC transporter, permease protein PhnE n=1 Tax=Rhizobium sp. TaxID=391 RepID=UPI000EBF3B28|nr:phosphonate ABC transporter, permease protein PhnE [Agrobacterium sp.]
MSLLKLETDVAAFPPRPRLSASRRVALLSLAVGLAAIYWFSIRLVEFDIQRLVDGMPMMAQWIMGSFPPDVSGFWLLLQRAGETVAMALVGTTLGCIIAFPLALMAASNTNPNVWLQQTVRGLLNGLRGIDSMIFAIIFVVAVGLGPFAGVLGISLHTAGLVAKLWSEAIETIDDGPLQAVTLTGATRLKMISLALVPDVFPSLSSIGIYVFEANVRGSTVLGLVGAGGIGQELKNSVDLLNFPRIFTIVMIILVMVTVVDQISAYIRRKTI